MVEIASDKASKQSKLFRQAALNRLSSPEQLQTLMRVTNAQGWLALVGCVLVIATAIVWGAFGRVQSKVPGTGILLGGAGLSEVTTPAEGDLVSIEVRAGDVVRKGQVVAKFRQPTLLAQLANTKRRLDELNADAKAGPLTPSQAGRLDRLKSDRDVLEQQLAENAHIESPVDGRVVEVRAMVGEHVGAGHPFAAIEVGGATDELEALVYFDSHAGKSLKPGMTIEIEPSVVRKERHGVLLGRVRTVAHYPSTRAGMMGTLRNDQLVEMFIQSAGGAPIAVRAELLPDKATPSGYRWSSGKGPSVTLTSGTQCSVAVVTRTYRPIALVFPSLDFGGS